MTDDDGDAQTLSSADASVVSARFEDDGPSRNGFSSDDDEAVSASHDDGDMFANVFTDELANVAASDWDVDTDALWGASDPEQYDAVNGSDSATLDFSA